MCGNPLPQLSVCTAKGYEETMNMPWNFFLLLYNFIIIFYFFKAGWFIELHAQYKTGRDTEASLQVFVSSIGAIV